MLSDLEIEAAYRKMIDRIDLVNDDYLKRVAEQIKKIGQLNPSSIHKLSQMRMYRGNIQQIRRKLAEALNISAGELQQLLERAAQEQYNDANFSAVVQNKRRKPLRYSEELKTYIAAVAQQTAERFANYSNTTVIDQNYQETVTNAIDAVTRGVTDYNSAIRDSMRKLGGDGLRVEYDSGVTRRMDTAIRQNVIDGVKQIQQEAARQAGEQMGADGVELSAHPFSAVDHEPAQGRMYTNAEFEKMQSGQPFEDAEGKHYDGFERPIAEWNCRHFASPVIIGVSPRRYTDEQLEAWKKKNHAGCDIGGKHYTVYEAGQLMRKIETKIRQQKDIANLAKRSGDNVLKREAQAKTVDLRAQYNVVAEAAGLKPRPERAIVESYTKEQTKEGERDAAQNYQNWSKEIGANASIETLANYYNVKYNDPPRYELLKQYAGDVKSGWLSPLAGFDRYEELYNRIQTEIVGKKTPNGIKITGQAKHFMQRVIGTMVDPDKLKNDMKIIRRSGVEYENVFNALFRPLRIGPIITRKDGKRSMRLYGERCSVSINPDTGQLIQTNKIGGDV